MYARDTECCVTSSIDRSLLRALPAALAVCTLAVVAALVRSSLEPFFGAWSRWVVLGVPTALAAAALVEVGLDVRETVSDRSGLAEWTRLRVAGRIFGWVLTVGLGGLTLWLVVGTIYVLRVDTGGGVLFGPILALGTASLLAVLVLARFAIPKVGAVRPAAS